MLNQNEIIKPDHYKPSIEICETAIIPYSHESRFVLRIIGWQVPIVNMRYEPFQSARHRLEDDRVWVRIWNRIIPKDDVDNGTCYWGCINDGRIPKELYAKSLCWITNFYPLVSPTTETAQEICDFAGLPNEVEQFIDPESYWRKRGAGFDEGWVTLPG